MGQKNKKPSNRMDQFKTIVEILTGIANIVLAVHSIFKG